MDTLSKKTQKQTLLNVAQARSAMPDIAPMDMPTQSLETWRSSDKRTLKAPQLWRTPWASRAFIFGGAALVTGFGAREMLRVVDVAGVTTLQWFLLILFTINFSWISLSFTSSVVGFLKLLKFGRSRPLPPALKSRTAVIMPIYNESAARVFGAMEAMALAVKGLGFLQNFDFVLLSDTTNPDAWVREEKAFLEIRARHDIPIFYRHRAKNTAKKAGNVAQFVSTYGGNYDHMIVLDADSALTAQTIVQLAAYMEKDPDSGIIQTLPLIVNRNTMFARLQQFAARIYGPVIATGLSAWMGRDGNYWGHNAIIRLQAFAEAGGLPELSGKPPFGGPILSHDFVEAALVRRRGYSVYMVPLEGSYEESPPSLLDMAARDRRWCQGNLQHSRVLGAKGLHMASRQHIATGIFSYLASPLWLLQILVGMVLSLQAALIRPEYFRGEFALIPTWPRFDPERAISLFIITMLILLLPKFLGLLYALYIKSVRQASGGAILLVLSTLFEIIFSALLAPLMMLIQTGSVLQILLGRDTGWQPQRRDDGSVPFGDLWRKHKMHTFLGAILGLSAFLISPMLFAWLSPTVLGLLLSVPLSAGTASLGAGLALKKVGLLQTPEETQPPEIVTKCNVSTVELEALGFDEGEGLALMKNHPELLKLHMDLLTPPPVNSRGHILPERAMAEAKLAQADTLQEFESWLSGPEKQIVLNDRALLGVAMKLK